MGLVPSETKTDLVAALAGVIPQPSLRAEWAHRKEKGNVAAPSSDKVCGERCVNVMCIQCKVLLSHPNAFGKAVYLPSTGCVKCGILVEI